MVNQSFRYTLFEEKLTKTLESKDKIDELFTILYRYNPPTELGTNSSSMCKSVILLTHYNNRRQKKDRQRFFHHKHGPATYYFKILAIKTGFSFLLCYLNLIIVTLFDL